MARTPSGWRGHSLTASQCPGSSSAESAQFGHRPRCQRVQWLRERDRISPEAPLRLRALNLHILRASCSDQSGWRPRWLTDPNSPQERLTPPHPPVRLRQPQPHLAGFFHRATEAGRRQRLARRGLAMVALRVTPLLHRSGRSAPSTGTGASCAIFDAH